jgi:replicative DNA helicase
MSVESVGGAMGSVGAVTLEAAVPAAPEVEAALIGACLAGEDGLRVASEELDGDEFHAPKNRAVWLGIEACVKGQQYVDQVTLAAMLESLGVLDAAGGRPYLAQLAQVPFTQDAVADYCQSLREFRELRRILKVCGAMMGQCYEAKRSSADLLLEMETQVFQLRHHKQGGLQPLATALKAAVARVEAASEASGGLTGIPTGFTELDDMLGGLQRTEVVIVAGRPGMGKTALALDFARAAGKAGFKSAIFSLEMANELLGLRMLAAQSEVDANRLRHGRLRDTEWENEWELIQQAYQDLVELPIYTDDDTDVTLATIRSRLRKMEAEIGLDLVIIDFLQLVRVKERENRHLDLSRLAQGLKQLARKMNCAVVVLSQLSRNVEKRDDKRPMLGDLAESGGIEAAADVVIFPFCPEYYRTRDADETKARKALKATISEQAFFDVAKNRNGPTGTLDVEFCRKLVHFREPPPKSATEGE